MSRYGAEHRAIRAAWAPEVAAGRVNCWRCNERIQPDEPWDLGHGDGAERDQYRGPEHAKHNRATRTHLAAQRQRPTEPHPGLRS